MNLKYYKQQLDKKNANYARNAAYYDGNNPTILAEVNRDQYGRVKAQDRRIPLPIGRKLINTLCGFTFSDIQYSETGDSIDKEMNFVNMVKLNNEKIDVSEKTEYFKYLTAVQKYNDHDIKTLQAAIECCNHGRAYKIWYFADTMLQCDVIPANQIYPIYSNTLNSILEKAIRYYEKEILDSDGNTSKIFCADVYHSRGIDHYEGKEGDYSDSKIVPKDSTVYGFENNIPEILHVAEFNILRDKKALIESAYGMIDEADRVLSKNMAEELGNSAAAILLTSFVFDRSFKDADGKTMYDRFQESNVLENFSKDSDFAEWLTKQVQDSFIFGVYDRIKKDVFEFLDIPNFSDGESWGNTISGVSAGYRLLGFLYLSSQVFRIFTEGLRAEIDIINAYAELLSNNEAVKKSMNVIDIKANRVLPKNTLENAQIAATLKDIVPDGDLIKMFPEIVSDPDGALKELEGQRDKASNRIMNGLNEPDNTGGAEDGLPDEEETNKEKVA